MKTPYNDRADVHQAAQGLIGCDAKDLEIARLREALESIADLKVMEEGCYYDLKYAVRVAQTALTPATNIKE